MQFAVETKCVSVSHCPFGHISNDSSATQRRQLKWNCILNDAYAKLILNYIPQGVVPISLDLLTGAVDVAGVFFQAYARSADGRDIPLILGEPNGCSYTSTDEKYTGDVILRLGKRFDGHSGYCLVNVPANRLEMLNLAEDDDVRAKEYFDGSFYVTTESYSTVMKTQ